MLHVISGFYQSTWGKKVTFQVGMYLVFEYYNISFHLLLSKIHVMEKSLVSSPFSNGIKGTLISKKYHILIQAPTISLSKTLTKIPKAMADLLCFKSHATTSE